MKEKPKGTFGWLWVFAAPHRSSFTLSLVFATAGVACSIVPYYFVSQIIIGLINNQQDFSFYSRYCFLAVGFWILRYIFHGISTTTSHKATFAVLSEIRLKLTQKLTRLPMGYLLDTPSGRLKNILVERVDSVETTLAHLVPEMGANILVALGTFIYLFALDWRMALAAMAVLPLGLFCYTGMMIGYEKRFTDYVSKNKHLNDTAVEYINGIEVIKAFNQSASSYEKFSAAAKDAANSAINWMRSTLPFFSLSLSVFPAVLVSVLPIGALLYMNGTLPMETFIVSIILSLGIMGPLITTMTYSDDIAKVRTIVSEITEVLCTPDLERPTVAVEIKDYNLELKGVSFGYNEKEILHKINLSIPAGSVTAFVGPSGSGKSTIAKLIASLWDVTAGQITLGARDIKEIPLGQLNSVIAYVAQDNYLFDETIMENIRMGNLNASDEDVIQAAKQSGCHEFIIALEKGYQTRTGGAGGHLSGGERQRITIARAMLKNAPIIILDEATAYTDPENEAVIQSAVSKLVQNKTLIVIAHRLSTISDSDNIVVIDNGTVSAQGTHKELLAQSKLYTQMWKAHTSAKDYKKEEKGEVTA